MSELYVKPDITTAFTIAKKTVEYGMSDKYGPTDLHTVDAFLELGQQVNGLAREHTDEDEPVFAGEPCWESVSTLLDENQPLTSAGEDNAEFDLGQFLVLLRAVKMIAQLLGFDLPFLRNV